MSKRESVKSGIRWSRIGLVIASAWVGVAVVACGAGEEFGDRDDEAGLAESEQTLSGCGDACPEGSNVDVFPLRTADQYCSLDKAGRLRITVLNDSDVSVAATTTRVVFSPGGTVTIPTPALGASASTTLLVTIPPACNNPDCDYTITADSSLTVAEDNETNNFVAGFCAPDLVAVPIASGPGGYCDYANGALTVHIKNRSTTYGAPATTARVFGLSVPVPALAPGAEVDLPIGLPFIPSPGGFDFSIEVDAGTTVRETNETNNTVTDTCPG